MAQIHWLNDVSGDFSNAADWSGGAVPGPSDDVTLGALGGTPYTVTASQDGEIASLQLAANASFVFEYNNQTSAFIIDNGTGGGANFGDIYVKSGVLELGGTLNNAGVVTVGDGTSVSYLAAFNNELTIEGGGQIILNGGILGNVSTNDLANFVNVDNTITGAIDIYTGDFTNGSAGLIDLTQTRGPFPFVGAQDVLTNDGLIEATVAGGRLNIYAWTLDQSSGGSVFAGAGTSMYLSSGNTIKPDIDLVGGTFDTQGSGVIYVSGGLLDGSKYMVDNEGLLSVSPYLAPVKSEEFDFLITGRIDNAGEILVDPQRTTRRFPYGPQLLVQGKAVLSGGGLVSLGAYGVLDGSASGASLTNTDNTIVGVGRIGFGLSVANDASGLVESSGLATQALTLQLGSGWTNDGLIQNATAKLILEDGQLSQSGGGAVDVEATTFLENADIEGGMVSIESHGLLATVGAEAAASIHGAVINDGRIEAFGATLNLDGPVSGTGLAVIAGGVLAVYSSFEERAQFLRGAGTLQLAQSQSYTGAVFGFALDGKTALDLRDIGFVGVGEASYSGTAAKGVLTVTDGTHTARIALVGDYLSAAFTTASDDAGGAVVTAAPSHAAFAAAAADFGAGPAVITGLANPANPAPTASLARPAI